MLISDLIKSLIVTNSIVPAVDASDTKSDESQKTSDLDIITDAYQSRKENRTTTLKKIDLCILEEGKTIVLMFYCI